MDQLHGWLQAQFAEHKTEPNSGLGKAITYLLRHWRPLRLFLRQAGAPLDNNIVERALKRAVLHRKNALFYPSPSGAQVGDLFRSLIHTCQLYGANSFDYLTQLQRHAGELARSPSKWMPWNYQEAVLRAGHEGSNKSHRLSFRDDVALGWQVCPTSDSCDNRKSRKRTPLHLQVSLTLRRTRYSRRPFVVLAPPDDAARTL